MHGKVVRQGHRAAAAALPRLGVEVPNCVPPRGSAPDDCFSDEDVSSSALLQRMLLRLGGGVGWHPIADRGSMDVMEGEHI